MNQLTYHVVNIIETQVPKHCIRRILPTLAAQPKIFHHFDLLNVNSKTFFKLIRNLSTAKYALLVHTPPRSRISSVLTPATCSPPKLAQAIAIYRAVSSVNGAKRSILEAP